MCEYHYIPAGVKVLTVDPSSEEPMFFSSIPSQKIRKLGACNKATHQFAGATSPEEIGLAPVPEQMVAMAVDPTRQSGAGRPVGELYAASPEPPKIPDRTAALPPPPQPAQDDALDLGATVLPVLAKTYWRQAVALVLVLLVLRRLLRRH